MREAPTTLEVQLSRCWTGPVTNSALHQTTVILHAPLDAKLAAAALATALTRMQDVAVVTRAPNLVKALIGDWLPWVKGKLIGAATRYDLEDHYLWVVSDEQKLIDAGARECHLVVCDAHQLRTDPAKELTPPSRTYFGRMPDRGHWLSALLATAHVERATADAICDCYPQQRRYRDEARQTLSPARYARSYELKDVVPPKYPFSVICRKRLWVRTDKSPAYLTQSQRLEAFKQLGEGWEKSTSAPVVPLELAPVQRLVVAHKRLGRKLGFRKFLVVKYRRAGMTIGEQADSYVQAVEQPNSYVASVADTQPRASTIFRVVKTYAERDPEAPRIVTESGGHMEFANGSFFFTGTAGGAAVARGFGLQKVHGFEVPYWCKGPRQMQEVELVMAGLMEAASNGVMVMEGTPNGREWVYVTYNDAKKRVNDWYPIFLRWMDDPRNVAAVGTYSPQEIVDTLTDEEKELVARYNLSPAQVAFRRQKKRALGRLFPQEYPEDDETCFITSGVCFFDVEKILALLEAVKEGERKHVKGGYEIEWEAPQLGVEYVLGSDTSEGLPNCDYNGLGVLRKDTGAMVAATHGLFSIRDQAESICRFSKRYNDALIGIERENHGHAVLQKVEDLGCGEPHFKGGPLYYCGESGATSMKQAMERGRSGWSTNGETRPVMLDELADALDQGHIKIRDRDFLGECLGFRRQHSGRFEAVAPDHDDTIFKWAIAWQMRKVRRRRAGKILVMEGGF